MASATGASRARVVVESVPSPAAGELSFKLVSNSRVWLYVADDAAWDRSEIERLAEPLGRLIDVAVERQRVAEQAAETEAARRAETARTAILHAISHDLRSPLTAITTAASALRAAAITDAERAELIDVIDSQSVRLAKLVDDLLDLGKIQAGAVLPRADWCDLQRRGRVGGRAPERRSPDRVRCCRSTCRWSAPTRPSSSACSRTCSRTRSSSRPTAVTGARQRGDGGRAGHDPRHRPGPRDPDPVPRAGVRAVLPRPRRHAARAPASGWRSAAGFVEANGGRIQLQGGADGGTSFAVSFPIVAQPSPVPR